MNATNEGLENVLGKARLCSASDLLAATEDAAHNLWGALLDRSSIDDLDSDDLHIVVPFLRKAGATVSEFYRCYLWFKHAGKQQRSCVVIDISAERIRQFPRPTTSQYDKLVLMLVEQLPIRFLDPAAD